MLDLETLRVVTNEYPTDSEIVIATAQQPDKRIPIGKVNVEFDTKTGEYTFIFIGDMPKA